MEGKSTEVYQYFKIRRSNGTLALLYGDPLRDKTVPLPPDDVDYIYRETDPAGVQQYKDTRSSLSNQRRNDAPIWSEPKQLWEEPIDTRPLFALVVVGSAPAQQVGMYDIYYMPSDGAYEISMNMQALNEDGSVNRDHPNGMHFAITTEGTRVAFDMMSGESPRQYKTSLPMTLTFETNGYVRFRENVRIEAFV